MGIYAFIVSDILSSNFEEENETKTSQIFEKFPLVLFHICTRNF